MGAFFASELTELNERLESDDHGYVAPTSGKKAKDKDKDADHDSQSSKSSSCGFKIKSKMKRLFIMSLKIISNINSG